MEEIVYAQQNGCGWSEQKLKRLRKIEMKKH